MPRIDDLAINKKVFKKKEYRSWDGNLVETLKIKPDTEAPAPIREKQIVHAEESAVITTVAPEQKPEIKTNDIIAPTEPRVQLGFNKGSSVVQLESNKGSNRVQSEFTKGSIEVQLESSQGSIGVQKNGELGLITDRNLIFKTIQKLSGNEKKIFFFAINLCAQKGDVSTGEINGNEFNKIIGTTKNGRETAIKRLCQRGLVKREKIRRGVGGALSIVTSELIKTDALNYLNTNLAGEELLTNLGANRVQLGFNNPLYSSSNIINKNTTTNVNPNNLPEEWALIDCSSLENIGFSKTQLRQLIDKNIPETVQESINHFAFEIESNPDKYKAPLNVLMGVLRKGNAWTAPKGYESPKDRALREYAERKKSEMEKRTRLVNDLIEAEFSDWESNLSESDLESILPPDVRNSRLSAARTSTLKNHFREQVLIPRLKKEGVY